MEEKLLVLALKKIPSGGVCLLFAVPQHGEGGSGVAGGGGLPWFFVNASTTVTHLYIVICPACGIYHKESVGHALRTECQVSCRFSRHQRLQK